MICLGNFTLETIKGGIRLTAAGKKWGVRPVNQSTKISISTLLSYPIIERPLNTREPVLVIHTP
jgi:hypothetical protein